MKMHDYDAGLREIKVMEQLLHPQKAEVEPEPEQPDNTGNILAVLQAVLAIAETSTQGQIVECLKRQIAQVERRGP